jgi:hypothetical protein
MFSVDQSADLPVGELRTEKAAEGGILLKTLWSY